MADHPLSDDEAIFDVYFSAKVDDIIAVSKYIYQFSQDSTTFVYKLGGPLIKRFQLKTPRL